MDVANLDQTIFASSNDHTYITTDRINESFFFFFLISNHCYFEFNNKNIPNITFTHI